MSKLTGVWLEHPIVRNLTAENAAEYETLRWAICKCVEQILYKVRC